MVFLLNAEHFNITVGRMMEGRIIRASELHPKTHCSSTYFIILPPMILPSSFFNVD